MNYYTRLKINNSKYRNVKINGFDSKKEHKRFYQLEIMLKAGLISNLQKQVKFELQEAFENNGVKYRAINYIADFVYFSNETKKNIVEDVKGYKTDVYLIKKKLFLKKFGDNYFFIET